MFINFTLNRVCGLFCKTVDVSESIHRAFQLPAAALSCAVFQVLALPSLYQSASENEGKKTWWSVTCSLPQDQTTFPDLPSATPHLDQIILRCRSLISVIQQHRACFIECRAVYLTELTSLDSAPQGLRNEFEASGENLYFQRVSPLSFAPWRYVTWEQNC